MSPIEMNSPVPCAGSDQGDDLAVITPKRLPPMRMPSHVDDVPAGLREALLAATDEGDPR